MSFCTDFEKQYRWLNIIKIMIVVDEILMIENIWMEMENEKEKSVANHVDEIGCLSPNTKNQSHAH